MPPFSPQHGLARAADDKCPKRLPELHYEAPSARPECEPIQHGAPSKQASKQAPLTRSAQKGRSKLYYETGLKPGHNLTWIDELNFQSKVSSFFAIPKSRSRAWFDKAVAPLGHLVMHEQRITSMGRG